MTDSGSDRRPGVPYRIRQAVGPWINRLARLFGQPDYHVRPTEYAGTVRCSLSELEATLQDAGFSWAPCSLYHRTPMDNRPSGSWTYRRSTLAERQLHVILYARSSDAVDVYAHAGCNWLRHPVEHARQVGIDRAEGSRRMRRWLDECSFDYHDEPKILRRTLHLLERVSERLFGRGGREPPGVSSR